MVVKFCEMFCESYVNSETYGVSEVRNEPVAAMNCISNGHTMLVFTSYIREET